MLVMVAVPGLVDRAHAQELFSEIPEGVTVPPSLGVRDGHMVRSEMVTLNTDVLQTDSLTITVFGETYTISRDSVEMHDGGYTWSGSGSQVMSAILVVDGTEAVGLIRTPAKTFEILHVSSNIHEIYELDMPSFPSTVVATQDGASGASSSINSALISQLESAYIGWHEYDEENPNNIVTIDVYAVITPKAAQDYGSSADNMARLAINDTNVIYQNNGLPIQLNHVHQKVMGDNSNYDDAGSLRSDLNNLMNSDQLAFQRIRAEIEEHKADIVVMFVGDYKPLVHDEKKDGDRDNQDPDNNCGFALDHLADSKATAFAAVEGVCIPAYSFAQVVGYLQGAGYNPEQSINREFGYGHGYYDEGDNRRTVMSQSGGNCDNPLTTEEEICKRDNIWSSPHEPFFGFDESHPAGTAENWNSRVLFATAPHIASLRGNATNYDSVPPTGSIMLPSPIPTSGTMEITATFSELIHEWFPPNITITDGITTTTATMTKSSGTSYTYSHMLDGERGTVHLVFSNARDLFGNPVVKTPTAGATFMANADDVVTPAPVGAITNIEDGFGSISPSRWTNDRDVDEGVDEGVDWTSSLPVEPVPYEGSVRYEESSTNKVLASNNCDGYCNLTLKTPLDTTEPLTISFDRYVDGKVDNDEGLYVQYSTDGGATWTTLASYTDDNGADTDRWEKSVIGLSIPESSAMFRIQAHSAEESNVDDRENVEVDNLDISRPMGAEPDATFTATLNAELTSITITLSKTTSVELSASDFKLSDGMVSSIHNPQNAAAKSLSVSGIPHDAPITVTYTGSAVDLGGGSFLNTGTNAIALPRSGITVFYDDFESNLDKWEETGEGDWIISSPASHSVPPVPNQLPSNMVLHSDDCDTSCMLTLKNPINLTVYAQATLSFWKFTDSGLDAGDYLKVELYDGTQWNTIYNWGRGNGYSSDWTGESYDLAGYLGTSEFSLRLVTKQDVHGEDVQLDDVKITATPRSGGGVPSDTIPPVITAPPDITVEATALNTPADDVSLGNATATDNSGSVTVTNNAPNTYPLGTTTVTWTATDDSNNTATDDQVVTIQDTTPPVFSNVPDDITVQATSDDGAAVTFATPTANDAVDGTITISSSHASGSTFPTGTTTVTFTAADDSSNQSTASFDVTVTQASSLPPGIIFSDDFESSLNQWTQTGDGNWRTVTSASQHEDTVPNHDPANLVLHADECTNSCTITLKNSIDMAGYSEATLSFWRFVDSIIGSGEYLKIELYDGSAWNTTHHWTDGNGDSDRWARESHDLGSYLTSDFNIRIVTHQNLHSKDVQLDDIKITATTRTGGEPPVITAPGDKTFEATAVRTPLTAAQIGAATATDDSGVPPAITSNAPDAFPIGDTVITWTATDGAGHSATAAQTITVRDTTKPVLETPPDMSRTTSGMSVQVEFDTPSATDIFPVTVSCDPPSGSTFDVGDTIVTCTATDENSNTDDVSFTVTIIHDANPDTAPVISSIPDVTLNYTQERTVPVSASDAEGDAITLSLVSPPGFATISGSTITIDPGSQDIGTHTVTVRAEANGRSDTEGFSVTVNALRPAAPHGLAAYHSAATSSSVPLAWHPTKNNGGCDVTDYVIQYKKSAASSWTTFDDGVSTYTRNTTVTGLAPDTPYQFRVAAVNCTETSPYSNTASAATRPQSCPGHQHMVDGQCENLVCNGGYVASGNTCVCPTTKPHEHDNACHELITCTGGKVQQGSTCQCPQSLPHEYAGTCYEAMTCTGGKVQQGNSCVCPAGQTDRDGTCATPPPRTVPAAPHGLAAYHSAVTSSSVPLAWHPTKNNGGCAVTDYVIQYKKSAASSWTTFNDGVSTSTYNNTVTGLVQDTPYQFRVAAVNCVGTSPYSNTASATTDPLACPGHQHVVNNQCVNLSCPKNYYATGNMCDPGHVTYSGYVFRDADEDGVRDSGEGGVPGKTVIAIAGGWDNGVYVHNQTLKSTTTSSSGYYILRDIPTGSDYVVVQVVHELTKDYTTPWHTTVQGTTNDGSRTFNVGLK